jgi:4-amino-4-deoxy-L-arabinose transferase-like glycosyltransferase
MVNSSSRAIVQMSRGVVRRWADAATKGRTARMANCLSRPAWLVAVATGLLLCIFWYTQITGSPVQSDSVATLQMGENLVHHGVLSIDSEPPIRPSMYREPVPGVIAAAMIAVVDAMHGPAPQAAYLSGDRARFIKQQNILWFLLLCVSAAIAVAWMAGSVYAGLAVAIVAQAFYFYPGARIFGIDTLFSDVPAAAVLALASLLWTRAVVQCAWRLAIVVGVCFALLTLIKAAVLYVFAGLIVATAIYYAWRRHRYAGWAATSMVACMSLSFAVLVVPWLWRNHALFGVAAVADRAGLSLYTRVLKDQMSAAEYRGSFYAWTPSPLRPLVGKLTGFRSADLQHGGLLQHFNHSRPPTAEYQQDQAAEEAGRPDQAVAWYVQGRAERVRLVQQFTAAGVANPWLAADQAMQTRALHYMAEHPWQHLKMTLPMMWRGALVAFPLLVVALVVAAWRRTDELLLYCVPSLGLILFYALFANFEERYGTPALPPALVVGAVVLCQIWPWRRGPAASKQGA